MGLQINTNVQSISAQRNLSSVKDSQNKALERLSSGNRIVRAGDDAAGLAISEKLKAEIRGSKQASRNAGDGISMVQVAEGGLNEISNILIRLRELSVQTASDTVGEEERKFADMEFQNLTTEIDRISQSTEFNGKSLLSGSGGSFDFQIGTGNDENFDRLTYDSEATNASGDTLGTNGLNVLDKSSAQSNLAALDNAINVVNGNRANLGALQNRLGSTINNLEIKSENLSTANSRIRDTDVAVQASELVRTNILSQASTSVLAQANQSKQAALRLIG